MLHPTRQKCHRSTYATTVALASLALALLSTSACGSDGGSDSRDAPVMVDAWERACWGGSGTPTPEAVELVMGTGIRTFEPLENGGDIPMRRGIQGGAHFEMHARMRGFEPGVKGDVTVPAPHSYFSGYDLEGNRITPLDCIFPRPYIEASQGADEGWYELELGAQVFVSQEVFPTLDGETVTIRLEVQDSQGHYAIVERTGVVDDLNPPITDGGVPDAGVDAGVPDAGPMDAGAP